MSGARSGGEATAEAKLAVVIREYKKLQDAVAKTRAETERLTGEADAAHARVQQWREKEGGGGGERAAAAAAAELEAELGRVKDASAKARSRRELLQRDVELLRKQHRTAEEAHEATAAVCGDLEAAVEKLNERMVQTVGQHNAAVRTPSTGGLRSVKEHKRDEAFQKQFDLPPSEVLLDRFRCSNSKLIPGFLHVSTSYVAFDALLPGDGQRVLVRLHDVGCVEKVRYLRLFDNALTIHCKSGEHIALNSFVRRTAAFDAIVAQAAKHGLDVGGGVPVGRPAARSTAW